MQKTQNLIASNDKSRIIAYNDSGVDCHALRCNARNDDGRVDCHDSSLFDKRLESRNDGKFFFKKKKKIVSFCGGDFCDFA
ncbi:hypothetical protein [Helicobacter sp. T3_23-1056]